LIVLIEKKVNKNKWGVRVKTLVYLDNGATTKAASEVIISMNRYYEDHFGNPSSMHNFGENAKKALENSRVIIAKSLSANPEEIIFTSGGTESNNLALKGIAFANRKKGNHLIISAIEHDCILKSCDSLRKEGYKVSYLAVDKEGFVRIEELKKMITERTILVSIIHGNNEIGTIQSLDQIYDICRRYKVYFHTDACQSYTKTEISSEYADMITINSHKIHGPKGVGALYLKKGTKIGCLMDGGGQEKGLRSGTENISGIVGFAKAVEISFKSKDNSINKMIKLRDYFIDNVLKIQGSVLNGATGRGRLCNNINVSFRYIEGESVMMNLDQKGICVSTGSACSSHSLDPSHVLMALENNHERAHGSLRFTISRYTTKKEIDYTLGELKKIIERLRKISSLGG
jgi:cysteine desulfurase